MTRVSATSVLSGVDESRSWSAQPKSLVCLGSNQPPENDAPALSVQPLPASSRNQTAETNSTKLSPPSWPPQPPEDLQHATLQDVRRRTHSGGQEAKQVHSAGVPAVQAEVRVASSLSFVADLLELTSLRRRRPSRSGGPSVTKGLLLAVCPLSARYWRRPLER